MKRFLISILKFLLSFAFLVLILIFSFKIILERNTTFNSIKKDTFTLILGDSQTEADLNDSIIPNSINLSNSGDPIFFNYIKLKYLLNNGLCPRTVILGFSPNNLHSKGFYEVPKMKSKLKEYFFVMNLEDLQDILAYNFEGGYRGLVSSLFYSPRKDNFWSSVDIKDIGIGSHRKLPLFNNGQLDKDIADGKIYSGQNPDTISIKYLNKIIALCEQHKIHLILLDTPLHKSLQFKEKIRRKSYINYMKGINKNITIWDYHDYELEDESFYDDNHLNEKGATIFSSFIKSKLLSLENK